MSKLWVHPPPPHTHTFFVYERESICIHTSHNAVQPPANSDITVKIVAVSPFPPLSKQWFTWLRCDLIIQAWWWPTSPLQQEQATLLSPHTRAHTRTHSQTHPHACARTHTQSHTHTKRENITSFKHLSSHTLPPLSPSLSHSLCVQLDHERQREWVRRRREKAKQGRWWGGCVDHACALTQFQRQQQQQTGRAAVREGRSEEEKQRGRLGGRVGVSVTGTKAAEDRCSFALKEQRRSYSGRREEVMILVRK